VTGHRLTLSYELSENGESDEPAQSTTLSGEELVRRFMEEFNAEEIMDDEADQATKDH
jgi:hypothetical protein